MTTAQTSLVVSLMALAFTIASFWWLHARRGSLVTARPHTYAFAASGDTLRLRLPLAIYNTGPQAQIITDLRAVFPAEASLPPLQWITTRTVLRPGKEDGFAFATPFAVPGRSVREVIAEFGDTSIWTPSPGTSYAIQLQARIHPADAWVDLAAFDWWAPRSEDIMRQYIAHRNENPASPSIPESE